MPRSQTASTCGREERDGAQGERDAALRNRQAPHVGNKKVFRVSLCSRGTDQTARQCGRHAAALKADSTPRSSALHQAVPASDIMGWAWCTLQVAMVASSTASAVDKMRGRHGPLLKPGAQAEGRKLMRQACSPSS